LLKISIKLVIGEFKILGHEFKKTPAILIDGHVKK